MIEDKPACPTHGVRFMHQGRGGGMTLKFGRWFACGICGFKRWLAETDDNVILTSAAVTAWLIALVVALHV